MVKMDRELVLGHLGEGGAENGRAGLRVSLWDFAGQEVFYVLHHLYLTRFAAYAVLFDMQVRPKPSEASGQLFNTSQILAYLCCQP